MKFTYAVFVSFFYIFVSIFWNLCKYQLEFWWPCEIKQIDWYLDIKRHQYSAIFNMRENALDLYDTGETFFRENAFIYKLNTKKILMWALKCHITNNCFCVDINLLNV